MGQELEQVELGDYGGGAPLLDYDERRRAARKQDKGIVQRFRCIDRRQGLVHDLAYRSGDHGGIAICAIKQSFLRDAADDCLATWNPDQIDADGDGYGNRCDADYDGDGTVGSADFNLLRRLFNRAQGDPDYQPAADDD